jgi:membrane protease YdiL (CAAX protease family)
MKRFIKVLIPFGIPVLSGAYLSYLLKYTYASNDKWYNYIFYLLGYIIFIVLLFFIFRLLYSRFFAFSNNYQIKLPDYWHIIVISLIIPGLYLLLDRIIIIISGAFDNISDANYSVDSSLKDTILYSIPAIILTPLLEELSFRLLVISPFRKLSGQIYAILISSLLFGFAHGSVWTVKLNAFIFGIIMSAILIITKNIVYPIIIHSFFNITATVLAVMYTIKPSLVATDQSTHLINANNYVLLCLCSVSVFGIVLLLYNYIKHRKAKTSAADLCKNSEP